MRNKTGTLIYTVVIGLFLVLLSSCDKDDPKAVGVLSTTAASDITQTSAISGGIVTADGGAEITARGICWSTGQSPTTADNKTTNGSGTGSFSSNITGLTPSTTYYVRAYATNSVGTSYGSAISFTTLKALEAPTLETQDVTDITLTMASSGGKITDNGGADIISHGICWSTHEAPTINDQKSVADIGDGILFYTNITYLNPSTTYYVRAYATNSIGTGYGNTVSFQTKEGVKDANGNIYSAVKIGTQTWMASNLKTTKFNDGTNIPLITEDTQWSSSNSPGYSWYNNDKATYENTYGAIYNWYAVDTDKLCPTGWHVPTENEWTILTNQLGGNSNAGKKLKETGTAHWPAPNDQATNEYGFTALPGGARHQTGPFSDINEIARWWSATDRSETDAWIYYIMSNSNYLFRGSGNGKKSGYYVRCVKDSE